MMFDRRLIQNFDWIFLCIVLILTGLGLLNLYSASSGAETTGLSVYVLRQMKWMLLGLAVITTILFFDYHYLERYAYFLYLLGILLLVLVLLKGTVVSGSKRWIFGFQPSELVKLFVIFTLARYFARREYPGGMRLRDMIPPMLIVGLPFLFIVKQPDLGTGLHLAILSLTVILFVKVRWNALIFLASGVVVALPFVWSFLESYQIKRIITFLNPDTDPRGAGYHIIQSKIAVGSGELWGKGFMKGTQSRLRFLPERHTDFVFSVFAEEWGFLGALFLLSIYFFLIIWGLQIIRHSQDRFGAILGDGLLAMIFLQFFINTCMVVGLMPVVGIPVPFLSYGGTSLLVTSIAVGLLLNISMRRFIFQTKMG